MLAGIYGRGRAGRHRLSHAGSGRSRGYRAGHGQPAPARRRRRASGAGRGILAPWVATSSRIAMGVTMAFMLLILI